MDGMETIGSQFGNGNLCMVIVQFYRAFALELKDDPRTIQILSEKNF